MPFFPDELYELIKERAQDNTRQDSKTKFLLEKGGSTIISSLIREAGEVAKAAMEQDHDQLITEIADLWYHSLMVMLYYGISPEQIQKSLAEYEQPAKRRELE